MDIQAYWQEFLASAGLDPNTKYYECFYFGMTEELANELAALVLSGEKRATSSLLPIYEAEGSPLPQVGSHSIVTDYAGTPRCVIRTSAVTLIPFDKMTYDICRREGEDECLETWQEGHRRFFSLECEEAGLTFTEDMQVVFEDFEVVYP